MIKDKLGLPENCNQYKGNLHSHTINSDGHLTPYESAEMFRTHGYSFVCFSDHERYTDYRKELNRDDFIILPGLEASANYFENEGDKRPLKVHHMNGILGTKEMENSHTQPKHLEIIPPPCYYHTWNGAKAGNELAEKLSSFGMLVTYNHPLWSRVTFPEFADIEGIWALEIFNYNTVNECAEGADTADWDRILRSGRNIYAFASDDNHNEGKFDDAMGGWIQVFAPKLTQDDIVNALLTGEFYSSSGPMIYGFGVKDGKAYVRCSECERINFVCGGFVGASKTFIAHSRDGLRDAEITLTGRETYIRAECIDYAGKCAWTNAIIG